MSELMSVVAELGLRVTTDGDLVRGRAEVQPEACMPGTDLVRTSVVATWADVVTGTIAGHAMNPRIPLTLDLEVQVERPARRATRIATEAKPLKVGRTIVVAEARFWEADTGAPLAIAIATFIASPNPTHVFPGGFPSLDGVHGRLALPLTERVGCTVVEPGTTELPHRPGNLNASGAVQGGIIALVAEEAVASLHEGPVLLRGLNVRYLRPVLVGPARAVATIAGGAAVVHVTDAGSGKPAAVVTARPELRTG